MFLQDKRPHTIEEQREAYFNIKDLEKASEVFI